VLLGYSPTGIVTLDATASLCEAETTGPITGTHSQPQLPFAEVADEDNRGCGQRSCTRRAQKKPSVTITHDTRLVFNSA